MEINLEFGPHSEQIGLVGNKLGVWTALGTDWLVEAILVSKYRQT